MTILNRLAKAFVERANTHGYKGKRRDDLAIEFFLGAAVALGLDTKEGQHVASYTALVVCIRGYSEVERLANEQGT